MKKYYVITLQNGDRLKAPVETYTEKQIRDHYKENLRDLTELVVLEESDNKALEPVLYWRIRRSYNRNDDIIIKENQLIKALYAYINKSTVVLDDAGFIGGAGIIDITPDYPMSLGLPRDTEMIQSDWIAIREKGIDRLLDEKNKTAISVIKEGRNSKQSMRELEQNYIKLSQKLLLKSQ